MLIKTNMPPGRPEKLLKKKKYQITLLFILTKMV